MSHRSVNPPSQPSSRLLWFGRVTHTARALTIVSADCHTPPVTAFPVCRPAVTTWIVLPAIALGEASVSDSRYLRIR
jgi:hypothetical protein